MAKKTSHALSVRISSGMAPVQSGAKPAQNIAGSLDWQTVQAEFAGVSLPPLLAGYVQGNETRARLYAASSVVADLLPPDKLTTPPALAAAFVDQTTVEAARIARSAPTYLALPPVLAGFAADGVYQSALPFGRVLYRRLQYVEDERGRRYYAPCRLSREDIAFMLNDLLHVPDARIALGSPLAQRVGLAVGFLSALSISQADDAQAGLTLLATQVYPLLGTAPAGTLSNRAARRAARKQGKKVQ